MKTIKTTVLLALFVAPVLPLNSGAQKTQDVKSGAATTGAVNQKLDPSIGAAIKQSQETAHPHSTMPTAAIPVRDGDKILVDLTANVSDDLRNQIAKLGGKILASPDPRHIIRVMMPLQQMEALASRSDVVSIVPAQLTYTSGTSSAQSITR
jgi:hypothetical protein